jgi:hypothetical protein
MAPGLWKILGCAVVWITLSHAALGQERYALLIGNKDYSAKVGALIPDPIDQNRCAHWRNPMDMMRQG